MIELCLNQYHMNPLSSILVALIVLVSISVQTYSFNYMEGDKRKLSFFVELNLLSLTAISMVMADNLWVFFASWVLSNLLLVKLMMHKKEWLAAKEAANLALKNFLFSSVTLFIALALLASISHSNNLSSLFTNLHEKTLFEIAAIPISSMELAVFLLLLTAMVQSAQYPFNKWLLSSLNSPTPVSAFMHAGLVNGGGILLAKFAPLYFAHSSNMHLVFLIGSISAFLGSAAMLVQTKIKNKLATSTMAQMGFMFMEIGLGLIPAAIAHLMMHGFFKAFLFLNAGSAVEKIKLSNENHKPLESLVFSFLFAGCGTYLFSMICGFNILAMDSHTVLAFFVFLAISQFLFTFLRSNQNFSYKSVIIAFSFLFSACYALLVNFFENLLESMHLVQINKIDMSHLTVMSIFFIAWLFVNLRKANVLEENSISPSISYPVYLRLINFAQPAAATITSKREEYKY